ncbi:MAG: OmpA family protein [Planctomycetota bacterium]|jgi:OOP family OmpA-OmpF porin
MKRKLLPAFSLMILLSMLAGCLQLQPRFFPHRVSLEEEFQVGKYVPKIKNFFIILDASSSMSVSYTGKSGGEDSKLTVAKDFIRYMNNTMPAMDVNGVIRTFGRGIEIPMQQTETVYGRTTYSRSGLEQSLNRINFLAEGNSPAGLAIKETSDTIGSIKGTNAVIFISDGEHLEGDPLTKVRNMEDRYGGWTCFYTVWIGNNPEGKLFMEELAREMDCSFSTSVEEIASDEDMINFVKQVFLTTDIDSDRDGVPDSLDKCPDTPIGVEVDGSGCPKVVQTDSDGDGVFDDVDECLDTPVGAIVDDRGCWVVKGVQFDYKKWDVKPQFNSNLDNIEDILKNNLGLKVRIEGHTDDVGSMKYNIGLSGKRAQAIKDYLVGKGIDPSRITTKGLGYSQPIADNDTPKGRSLNRRAEIIPVK